MARQVRLRHVDTNPIGVPTRRWESDQWARRFGDAERFAKCAIVVAAVYTHHLEHGPHLPARTPWARFLPANTRPHTFTGHPADGNLGMGEVHEVPYEATVLDLPDHQRRHAILDWLHGNLLELARSLNWPTGPLDHAYQGCLTDDCRFHRSGTPKSDPGRRRRARIEYEIDGNGDAWTWAVVTDNVGHHIATSDRYDAVPEARPLARATRTLRWHGDRVGWTSWASGDVNFGYKDLTQIRTLVVP